jgi:hypothetical protein
MSDDNEADDGLAIAIKKRLGLARLLALTSCFVGLSGVWTYGTFLLSLVQ